MGHGSPLLHFVAQQVRLTRFPFKGSNDKELVRSILKDPVGIPSWIDESDKILLLRMLDKDPSTRISAKELKKLITMGILN